MHMLFSVSTKVKYFVLTLTHRVTVEPVCGGRLDKQLSRGWKVHTTEWVEGCVGGVCVGWGWEGLQGKKNLLSCFLALPPHISCQLHCPLS